MATLSSHSPNTSLISVYVEVAEAYADLHVGLTYDTSVKNHYGLNELVSLILFRKEEPWQIVYDGKPNKDHIIDFLTANFQPNVTMFTCVHVPVFETNTLKYSVYLFLLGSDPQLEEIRANFSLVAGDFKSTVRLIGV
ncbi:unnamed protein product [Protopolystoma xenopodis]|uniref:Uncharacterized protein n=1 Tax=Protopolystoma xenopodis TaxID=117903 RepID=A0A3S5AT47_9PLAT|nr:unnamed protein product [Protopolystoma xenopodis]